MRLTSTLSKVQSQAFTELRCGNKSSTQHMHEPNVDPLYSPIPSFNRAQMLDTARARARTLQTRTAQACLHMCKMCTVLHPAAGHQLQRPPSHNSGHCGGGEPKLVRQGYRHRRAPPPVRRTCFSRQRQSVRELPGQRVSSHGRVVVAAGITAATRLLNRLHVVNTGAGEFVMALQPGPGYML